MLQFGGSLWSSSLVNVKAFWVRKSCRRLVKLPIDAVTAPVNLFASSTRCVRFVKLPIVE